MNSTNSSSGTSDCLPLQIFASVNLVNLPSSAKATWSTLLAVHCIATPVMFAINFLIIWVVLERESLRSDKSILLLAFLAITDLFVSVTVQPILIWLLACLLRGCTVPCLLLKVHVPMSLLTIMLTLSSLMMVSTERYLRIEHPLFYARIKTKHIVRSALVIWTFVLVALLTGTLLQPVVGTKPAIAIVLVILILEVIVILYCTGKVQLTSRRHINAIVRRHVEVRQGATDQEKEEHRRRYQEYMHAMTVGMIVLANFILYCPIILIMILSATKQIENTGDFRYISISLVVTFFNLQSIVNPIIVSFRLSSIRKAIEEKLYTIFISS